MVRQARISSATVGLKSSAKGQIGSCVAWCIIAQSGGHWAGERIAQGHQGSDHLITRIITASFLIGAVRPLLRQALLHPALCFSGEDRVARDHGRLTEGRRQDVPPMREGGVPRGTSRFDIRPHEPRCCTGKSLDASRSRLPLVEEAGTCQRFNEERCRVKRIGAAEPAVGLLLLQSQSSSRSVPMLGSECRCEPCCERLSHQSWHACDRTARSMRLDRHG
jgi:hypothetical protein